MSHRHLSSILRAGASLVACTLAASLFAAVQVTRLQCEFATNPLGIDAAQPRLFWQLASDERAQRQTAWQVLVASSPENLAQDRGDLWDSGRVGSADTAYIAYAGTPLKSSQQVHWKVRAWDREGRPSAWSAPATWTMGVLAGADWQGAWIAGPGATETLLLRREFEVKLGLRRALVHVSGLGHYELTLNGTKAGDAYLTPGWSDYDSTTLYDTLDITSQLRAGRNAVGLFLGNGMYNVVRRNRARFTKLTGSYGPLRAIVNLRLEYADGTVDTVATDEQWRTLAGPVTFSSIYGGEDHDARLEPVGWNQPGFNDSLWQPALQQSGAGKSLRGHGAGSEPVRAIETRRPVGVKPFPDGSVVYDLGQNTSYIPRLRISGPAGSSVRLVPAEVTHPDGTINRNTMGNETRGIAWWQYTKSTDAEETWTPRFFYSGGRFFKATFTPAVPDGPPPRIELLEGLVVHASAAPAGRFAASNELLGRIRDLVRWAQRSNLVSVLTDCPHREKLGWLEQFHLNGPSVRYEFDVARFYTKAMHDMASGQTEDGLIPNIAPEYTRFKGTFRAAAEWGGSFIIVPWQQYEFAGDVALLRDYYPAMKRYFAYLESRTKDGILSEGLGDWYDLGPNKPGHSQLTPPPITATAYYFHDAKLLADAARLLGKADEAAEFARKADAIRATYNRTFFHADTGTYATNSQCANALPLVFGIVEESERPRVFAALVRDVEQRGYSMTAGDVGFRYLLRALADGGRSDVIYRMINQDEKPGYAYILKKGETSLTESWDANLGSSHNHLMLGQITEWFYGDLVGIKPAPDGAGFRKIVIAPQPVGDLTWAEGSYEAITGPIKVRWERAGSKFTLRCTIPANTTAEVALPSREPSAVREGASPATSAPGIRFLRRNADRDLFAVESGTYVFESVW